MTDKVSELLLETASKGSGACLFGPTIMGLGWENRTTVPLTYCTYLPSLSSFKMFMSVYLVGVGARVAFRGQFVGVVSSLPHVMRSELRSLGLAMKAITC